MQSFLKLGLIGLDTSHATAFTQLLNDSGHPFHVTGAKVVAGFPGASPDFDLSANRVEGFTKKLQEEFGVAILGSPTEVAEASDAILITAVDGRAHLGFLEQVASFGKPVFIDKPFAVTAADAQAMAQLAAAHSIGLFSASSLRYADALVHALAENPELKGADCAGPMNWQPTQPGYFWYGIHSVEMLYAALGSGCQKVLAASTENYDVVTGVWADGRIGTVRGNRIGNNNFTALLHTADKSVFVDTSAYPRPAYAGLLEAALKMFRDGTPAVPLHETVEIIRFIEAANQSAASGEWVVL